MRNVAGVTLTASSLFLTIVAVALNSGALFYMGTAMVATILACRLQAWLSVRGLRFERLAPPTVTAGDLVTVELAVWSEHAIRRPLISVADDLPTTIPISERTPSLPIAPAHNVPIRTQYQFRPTRRGVFRWNTLSVSGTDALGLVRTSKTYKTEAAEITVVPVPVPVRIELPRAAGWGLSETEHGRSRGAGIEPRGIREYSTGDSLRYVHWRSSARSTQLLVKEFETGAFGRACFFMQRTVGTDLGMTGKSSLDLMCGHVAFIADTLLAQGSEVLLPTIERIPDAGTSHERSQAIRKSLAGVCADRHDSVGSELVAGQASITPGTTVYVALAVRDDSLPTHAVRVRAAGVQVVALLYDPTQFAESWAKPKIATPLAPDYLDRLRACGVRIVVMPKGGES